MSEPAPQRTGRERLLRELYFNRTGLLFLITLLIAVGIFAISARTHGNANVFWLTLGTGMVAPSAYAAFSNFLCVGRALKAPAKAPSPPPIRLPRCPSPPECCSHNGSSSSSATATRPCATTTFTTCEPTRKRRVAHSKTARRAPWLRAVAVRDTGEMVTVRAAKAHAIPGRPPIQVTAGQRVQVGERDSTWPAFAFVTTGDGSGWVPNDTIEPVPAT